MLGLGGRRAVFVGSSEAAHCVRYVRPRERLLPFMEGSGLVTEKSRLCAESHRKRRDTIANTSALPLWCH